MVTTRAAPGLRAPDQICHPTRYGRHVDSIRSTYCWPAFPKGCDTHFRPRATLRGRVCRVPCPRSRRHAHAKQQRSNASVGMFCFARAWHPDFQSSPPTNAFPSLGCSPYCRGSCFVSVAAGSSRARATRAISDARPAGTSHKPIRGAGESLCRAADVWRSRRPAADARQPLPGNAVRRLPPPPVPFRPTHLQQSGRRRRSIHTRSAARSRLHRRR